MRGKTSRRSHDRAAGQPPLHLVSAFATTARLVLGQEAVADKSSETTAIPVLLERLGRDGGLKGAIVSIDATNALIAGAIQAQGADYLLAVKANQPTLRGEVEAYFADRPPTPSTPPSASTRATAASSNGPSPPRARPTGSAATAAVRARCGCQAPPPSSGSSHAPG